MNRDDKLEIIEQRLSEHSDHDACDGISELIQDDVQWLITRIKYLTEIIKSKCACYKSDNPTYAFKCSWCEVLEDK